MGPYFQILSTHPYQWVIFHSDGSMQSFCRSQETWNRRVSPVKLQTHIQSAILIQDPGAHHPKADDQKLTTKQSTTGVPVCLSSS